MKLKVGKVGLLLCKCQLLLRRYDGERKVFIHAWQMFEFQAKWRKIKCILHKIHVKYLVSEKVTLVRVNVNC